ncbi:MAG: hypothetical protein A2782_03320 [Candidatus Blackburnbacteria bacterium RIFCSPHIGHO2_01_FULL_43_15b]|uniref:Uncharacterized protein n=1 Tax=Candidatus Blackburnbacteria bacterium RIFCSPHIGHO2_01_FULL_43_15b TaxID=1797513 RepID=A0A1G1V064_9BACT|nr:MAG: hypothetical protein A2782_03320 [Candidatus Blackburnbacteria bacterium RIFCSPHIGHO2_01_FULL_43_15b]
MAMGNEERNSQLRFTRRKIITTVFSVSAVSVAANALKPFDALADGSQVPLEQFLPPSAINTESNKDVILRKTGEIVQKLGEIFPDAETRVNALGARLSDWWKGADGFGYMEWQRSRIQEFPSGEIALWNELDNMSEYGLDPKLHDGTYGVTIPPVQRFQDRATDLEGIIRERADILRMPSDVWTRLQEIRSFFEMGVLQAFFDYGSYSVWRFQRGALQKWTDGPDRGLIQGILVGEASVKAGLVPKDVLLDKPDIGSGGGNPEDARTLPWPERFGDLERDGVEFINRGKSSGMFPDEELFTNMLWRRDSYAKYPNVKRRFYFYDDINQLRLLSEVPYRYPENTAIEPYPHPFEYAETRWVQYPDGTVGFHLTLPNLPANTSIPLGEQGNAGVFIAGIVQRSLFSETDGGIATNDRYGVNGIIRGSQKERDYSSHPVTDSPFGTTLQYKRLALNIIRV